LRKTYEVEVSRTAEKQLRKLARADQVRVIAAIQKLAVDPRPQGCRKLAGYDDVFRIRVGTYRVIYSITDRRLQIIVLKVGHRKDIYR
jgi:mRNA interferase RelE/StbE